MESSRGALDRAIAEDVKNSWAARHNEFGASCPCDALAVSLWCTELLSRMRVWLYEIGYFRQQRLKKPVISVGNLTLGGTGKTPVDLASGKTAGGREARGILEPWLSRKRPNER